MNPINPAKLAIPRPPSGAVSRTALIRRLIASHERPLVVLDAPPGYGKTTVLAQWAAADARPTAWLTLDPFDNDASVLVSHLAAAIDRIEPIDDDVFAALSAPGSPTLARTLRPLVAALHEARQPTLVVLDDAHVLAERDSLDVVVELMTCLPLGWQLAIGAREASRLPLVRLRLSGMLLELGPGDLRFDASEAQSLFSAAGVPLEEDALGQLIAKTDGWPAMLALVRLSAEASGDVEGPSVGSAAGFIADYLHAELIEKRSEAEIRFITRVAILDRMCGPLCDAVAGSAGSSRSLVVLERATHLVARVGSTAGEEWLRFHSILREFLVRELAMREPEIIPDLHLRAARWHLDQGNAESAFDHALAGGGVDLAAEVVGRSAMRLHARGRRATVRAWIARFDDEGLARHPWLAVFGAFQEIASGEVLGTERYATVAARVRGAPRPPIGMASFESGRLLLRVLLGRHGPEAMLDDAQRIVSLEAPGSQWFSFGLWALANAHLVTGDPEAADRVLVDAIAAAQAEGNPLSGQVALAQRALLAREAGQEAAAAELARQAHDLAVSAHVEGYLLAAPAMAAIALAAAHGADSERARVTLAEAGRLRPLLTTAVPWLSVLSLLGLARAHLATGNAAGARTVLSQADAILRIRPDLGVLPGQVQRLHQTIASMPISVAGASTLTASELRVLAYLPTHLTLADIAERLGVTRHTIKSHAISIYGKLDAASRRSAVESAIDAGLLPASMAPGLSRTMVVEPGYGAPVDGTEARERPPGSG